MALIGKRPMMGRARALPPTPYGTRDPAKIVAMNEAAQPGSSEVMERPSRGALFGRGASAVAMPESPPQMMQERHAQGLSLPSGFDYGRAREMLMGNQERPEWWRYALAAVGDGIARHQGAGGPSALAALNRQVQGQRDRRNFADQTIANWQYRDFARQNEADLRASNPFTIGRDRLQYDPLTGQTSTIYDGPEDFELYASHLGLEPGTPEYFQAVEDHVLRSSGPSAHERDLAADDYRTANDERLEGVRFDNRRELEGIRQGNRLQVIGARGATRRPRGRQGELPVFNTPEELRAAGLPSGTPFLTGNGQRKYVP